MWARLSAQATVHTAPAQLQAAGHAPKVSEVILPRHMQGPAAVTVHAGVGSLEHACMDIPIQAGLP